MIRLTKLADYAFVLLTQMVRQDGRECSAAGLAARAGLAEPTAAKIMKQLARAGIVTSARGAAGGYQLARKAEAVSVAAVIEALEGPIALTDCVDSHEADCAAQSVCPMHGGWNKINRAVRDALTNVSLADMAGEGLPMQTGADFMIQAILQDEAV